MTRRVRGLTAGGVRREMVGDREPPLGREATPGARPDPAGTSGVEVGKGGAASHSDGVVGPRVTPAIVAYLRAVFLLHQGGDSVPTLRIADELGVSGPSVTNMVKRLHTLGLLRHERYRGVELTEAGERIALRATRLHRLLELYLVEALGFSWDEVHDEADRLMPHVSEKLETRLDAVLGHPSRDPHGDPIPTRDGVVAPVSNRRLLDLPPGARAEVARVGDRDPARLRYLRELGLYPGTEVTLLERLPFDGPVKIRVGAIEQILGQSLAAAVHVVEVGPAVSPPRVGASASVPADAP